MKHDLATGCCALLGLMAAATVADAYPLGGGSTVRSSPSIHNSLSSSLGDTRHDHWKRPFDSDDGGDPAPKKTPGGTGKLGCKQRNPC